MSFFLTEKSFQLCGRSHLQMKQQSQILGGCWGKIKSSEQVILTSLLAYMRTENYGKLGSWTKNKKHSPLRLNSLHGAVV